MLVIYHLYVQMNTCKSICWLTYYFFYYQLDGVTTVPPVSPHEGIKISQQPTRIYIETDFGLSINFDGIENAGKY